MATYVKQYSSGDATASTGLGIAGMGIRNDSMGQINPTNLAYGFYSIDASGRIQVTGNLGITGSVGVASGSLTAYAVQSGAWYTTASAYQSTSPWIVSGNVSATQVTSPWVISGNVSATQQTSPWVVSGQTSATAAQSGSWNITGVGYVSGGSALYVTASGQVTAFGDVAHDGADSGNPVKIGMVATAFGANPTAVAAGDRTNVYANLAGVPFVLGGHPNPVCICMATAAATSNHPLVSVGAGTRIVLTCMEATLDADTNAAAGITAAFATGNIDAASGVVMAHAGLPPGGGIVLGNGGGILGVGADAEDLRISVEAAAGAGGWRVRATYFTIPA